MQLILIILVAMIDNGFIPHKYGFKIYKLPEATGIVIVAFCFFRSFQKRIKKPIIPRQTKNVYLQHTLVALGSFRRG